MSDFVQPPLALFTDDRLTDGDRTVYCLLASFGDHGSLANCKPSVAAIAKRGGRSRRAVVENLKHLALTGWIVREGRIDENGDKDTTLYSFPLHRVVTETALPSAPNRPTVVTETALRVVTETALGVVTETAHNLEPLTKIQEPREQLSLSMPASKPPKASKPMNPTFAKAFKVAEMWNATMKDQPIAVADVRNMRVLAAALDLHGEDGLLKLLTWAHTRDWHSGRKGSRQIGVWMARDSLSVVAKDFQNAANAQRQVAPNDYKTIAPQRNRRDDD